MLESLFAPTMGELRRALEYESARQRVVAHNIANVNTPGYRAKRLFRIALQEAEGRIPDVPLPEIGRSSRSRSKPLEVRDAEDEPLRPDGNNVNLEAELVSLAEAELRYRALSSMAARYFQGLRRVIGGGGR